VPTPPTDAVVVDASALVDVLLGNGPGLAARERMRGRALHAPGHLDAEVLSALGRIHRSGRPSAALTARLLDELAAAPIERHPLTSLISGAWARRTQHRLVDALYVELAVALGSLPLLTTDARLARGCELAELVDA
jgi:predicted nucleic acid-binding protein